jgi:hypothetical protein
MPDDFESRIPEGMVEKYRSMRGVTSDIESAVHHQDVEGGSNRIDISWKDYIEDLEELALRVGQLGSFSSIYGIPPHGIFPALYLSYQLGRRLVMGAEVIIETNESPESLLVVDGSCSNGASLIPYRVSVKTAVIYLEPSQRRICTPELAVLEVAGQVRFPYEQKVHK